MTDTSSPDRPSSTLDTTVPHSARIWNYWLGGKDNFAIDREVGEQIREINSGIVDIARADRAFLGRAVRYVVGENGVRQLLDIGTGLPTADNTHQVAQRIAPECRVVYVDNDPLVLVHARALLVSSPEGACDFIDADVHDPDTILERAAKTLDFSEPIALMMLAIVQFILDDDEAKAVVHRLVDAVPSGSYLVMSHATNEVNTEVMDAHLAHWNAHGTPKFCYRSRAQVAELLAGLELVEPGVVLLPFWRPDPADTPVPMDGNCAVGRKP
jgi:O-methyltransferase involved in polyketide biosynthesis